jgi:hypothetical protein
MSYQLNTAGEAAVARWIKEIGANWSLPATCAEIDEVLANRSEGESLEVEMRGPNWKGGNTGLVFFCPTADEVESFDDAN